MRHIIWKNFAAWDYDKEEIWINEMSSRGLQLVSPGIGRYTFEDGTPGEYQYRIEYLDKWPSHPESSAYIHFLEDAGAEHIGSVKNWVYFRKKASDGSFDLFNDIDSRLNHIRKIFRLLFVLLPICLFWIAYTFVVLIEKNNFILYLCLALATVFSGFLLYGVIKTGTKIKSLKKERLIHE